MLPDRQTIEDIAAELGVSPAFVEKDWHAVRLLGAINQRFLAPPVPVFGGGTSLSKGYGLIERFSEDLDFRLDPQSPNVGGRSIWRDFRRRLTEGVEEIDGLHVDTDSIEKGSSFFKLSVRYDNLFKVPDSLRPHLQLEFSYNRPRRKTQRLRISSFIALYSRAEPETEVPCVAPAETAADKLCALTWRVLARDRNSVHDDPTIVRHLHDLRALLDVIELDERFMKDLEAAHESDARTPRRRIGRGLRDGMRAARDRLSEDHLWREEYDRFVAGTWYGDDSGKISFDEAMSGFNRIIEAL